MRLQLSAILRSEPGHRLLYRQGGAHCPLRVVAVGDGGAEHGHDAVADVLVDSAAMALDDAVDGVEERAEQPVELL